MIVIIKSQIRLNENNNVRIFVSHFNKGTHIFLTMAGSNITLKESNSN